MKTDVLSPKRRMGEKYKILLIMLSLNKRVSHVAE
jgi:hypothetical protein